MQGLHLPANIHPICYKQNSKKGHAGTTAFLVINTLPYDRNGHLLATKLQPIQAYRRSKGLLWEYFPGLAGYEINSGYISVTSDRDLASYCMFGTGDWTALSAVPAQIVT